MKSIVSGRMTPMRRRSRFDASNAMTVGVSQGPPMAFSMTPVWRVISSAEHDDNTAIALAVSRREGM
jgi:hypothetical protein